MTLLQIIILLVIAGVCGSLGQAIAGVSRGGCLVSIVIGFIGALIGMYLQSWLHLPELLTIQGFEVVWAIIGSALFVAVLSLFTRRSRRND